MVIRGTRNGVSNDHTKRIMILSGVLPLKISLKAGVAIAAGIALTKRTAIDNSLLNHNACVTTYSMIGSTIIEMTTKYTHFTG